LEFPRTPAFEYRSRAGYLYRWPAYFDGVQSPDGGRAEALIDRLLAPGPGLGGELDLARIVAARIGSPKIDLASIVAAWVAAFPRLDLAPSLRAGLGELAATGRPPAEADGAEDLGAAAVVLPLVARYWNNDRALVSAAFHLSRLIDPVPSNQWRAVGVSLVTAYFLQGQTDPVPEVAAALRANDAPEGLGRALARIPVWHRSEGHGSGDFEGLLWCLFHEKPGAQFPVTLRDRAPLVQRLARVMDFARIRER